VDEASVPHDREEQRTARPAAGVVLIVLTDDEQGVRARGQLELVPLDPPTSARPA
jgi:hypothetical protein